VPKSKQSIHTVINTSQAQDSILVDYYLYGLFSDSLQASTRGLPYYSEPIWYSTMSPI